MDEQAYIAEYFEGALSDEERERFEKRCVEDRLFAQAVADYVMARDVLRAELHQQKRSDFAALYTSMSAEDPEGKRWVADPLKPYLKLRKLAIYGAAACIALLLVVWFVLLDYKQPKEMAEAYVATHFKQLGVTMGVDGKEKMQQGIEAFNAGNYAEAERVFQSLVADSSLKSEAIKNLGISQLMQDNYSEAIESFEQLARMDLLTNPGLFYQSVALMKRAGPGDLEAAKLALENVVKGNLAGREQAEIWLKEL